MHAALTLDNGGPQWPDQAKARKMGVDRLGYPTNDPRLNWKAADGTAYLEVLRAAGWSLFAFRALWGWSGSPEGWAQAFRDDLQRLDMLPVTSGSNRHTARQCALDADLEVD